VGDDAADTAGSDEKDLVHGDDAPRGGGKRAGWQEIPAADFPDNFCIARCFPGRKDFRSNRNHSPMKYQTNIRRRIAAGFTLLEMVIVLGIIAVLLGGSIALIGGVGEGAKLQRVDQDFLAIGNALKTYKINAGTYPSTAQGLKALVEKPGGSPQPRRWVQVMKKMPTDPWGKEYGYLFPGRKDPNEFEIICKGKDGIESGDDLSSQDE
jgi:general secretion pathway protein G